jgi:DNA-binding transcriptional ArsR family regulator
MERDNLYEVKRLSANNEYYSNVFKKTERMVSVVFYILSYIEKNEHTNFHIKNISEKAMQVHEVSLSTLSLYEYEAKEKIFSFQQSLVALEGVLRIGNAARVLTDEVLALLLNEVDLVQRYLRNHFLGSVPLTVREQSDSQTHVSPSAIIDRPKTERRTTSAVRPSRVTIPKGDISSDAHMVYSQLVDRSVRIRTVLEAKPEATIKDIAEVITDVGEKTIQRELNSLIEKGQVIRQGERRWSKYSLAK